jgi:hypothetical protein
VVLVGCSGTWGTDLVGCEDDQLRTKYSVCSELTLVVVLGGLGFVVVLGGSGFFDVGFAVGPGSPLSTQCPPIHVMMYV